MDAAGHDAMLIVDTVSSLASIEFLMAEHMVGNAFDPPLGKAGWVTARFEKSEDVPVDLLKQWIDESYTAVAPKRGLKETASRKPATRRRKRA